MAACGGPPPPAPPDTNPPLHGAGVVDAGAPSAKETTPMNPKEAAQAIVKKLVAHDFKGVVANFGPQMKEAVDVPKLEQVWGQLEEAGGAFEGMSDIQEQKATGATVIVLTAKFQKTSFDVTVAIDDKTQEVQGLLVRPKNMHPYKPAAYADPALFTEKEVTVGTGALALPGTLTLPKLEAGKKAPGLVLVHGSGPQDKDETIGGIKVFRDLAQGLASRGVAVLRYEKRTRAHAEEVTQHIDDLTPKEEVIDDAVLAVKLLAADPGVDPKKVYVLGHSMGATFAPRIAQAAPDVAGLVLLAGSTRPLEDVILEQHKYILDVKKVPDQAKNAMLSELEKQVKAVKDPKLSPATPAQDLPLGIGAKYWLDIKGYDPAAAAAALKKPVLILQGGRDFQVTRADYARYEKAFAGRKDATLKLLPKMNHVFVAAAADAPPMSTPDEYDADANVDVAVIDEITKFMKPTPPKK
jgi:dienelactone hydrolase